MLHAVIMAGGAGTRFWPISRERLPKQLLPLAGSRSMIQETLDRLDGLVPPERVLVLTNHQLVAQMRRQLPDIPPAAILGEPCKRDTAPCIGLAAGLVLRNDPDAVMVVLPADHVIRPLDRFQEAVRTAVQTVERDAKFLVTFGIPPSYPATSYGYIERSELLDASRIPVYQVRRFREKPDRQQAEQFLAAGGFYWNSGIFVWRARTIWDALARYEPDMVQALQPIVEAYGTDAFDRVFCDNFSKIQGKSIDYAVMEHYSPIAVVEAPFQWDDVGNWQSVARIRGTDEQGNCATGKRLLIDCRNTIVWGSEEHLVVLVGMEDAIVVHTPDATLVAHRQAEESLREVVRKLREQGWEDYL
ncbi:MAG: mannose-1-phosphate guanylyltransferase [Pirellulaceae bacterium]|nr:MAG: mannose-1-phosphate guanylyltransferase [Pirellulaceae bacterium]